MCSSDLEIKTLLAAPPADERQDVAPVASTKKAIPSGTIEVNKFLFYKLFQTCVQGYGAQLNKQAGVTKFGAVLGGTTPQEYKAKWDECKKYILENK